MRLATILLFAIAVVAAVLITCAPPPKPDIDPNNAEFSVDVPANAASEDTVGEFVTFQISQTMPGWLDSVVVVVTNRSDDQVDTTIRLAGPFVEAMTFTIVFGTPGTKALDATAYFREGVEKTDQVIFLVIALPDTVPPEIAITTPADSDTVHVAAMPLTIFGTASDESGVSAVTYLTIHGTQRDSGDAEGTTSWSVDSLDLDTGATKIIITATDSAGNVAADTVVVVYVLPPDTTPPVVAITAPADSDTVHVACTPLSLSGAAQDESGISAVTYLTIHGTQRDSGDVEGTTSWSVDSLDLDTGATKIIIRAVDSADNRGADTIVVMYEDTSSSVTPDQDSTPPAVTITAPADSDTVHISSVPVTVSGTANDDSGIARVEYSLLVGTSNNSPAVQGKTTWSIAGLQLRVGTAVIEVRATDSAGNVGADTIAIVYDTTSAPQPPVITSQPGDMQVVINQSATFTVRATGAGSLTFAWKRGTTALTGSDSTYRIAMAQFTDSGTYTCIVTDANGLSDTTTPWRLQVLASSTPPSITTPPASVTVSEGDSVSLSVTASGTSLTYQWYKDGDSIPGATARVFHIDTAEFSDSGSYTVKVCNAQKCTTSAAAPLTVQTGSFGITVTAGAHGSITPAGTSGVVTVARGANQVFTITPATGYHVDTVRVDDTVNVAAKNAGSFTFSNVTDNHMISATFAVNTYTLTVTSLHGTVTTNPSTSGPVNHGTQVTLHAAPSAGYYFTGWSGGVTSSDTPLVITMVSDTEITANFAAIGRFSINVTASHGSVSMAPDSADYLKGTKVKLTATPDPGYDFVQWTGDASGTKDTVTITVDTTKNVTAVFAIKTYTLAVTATNGTVTKAVDGTPTTAASFDSGTVVTLTATPNAGYDTLRWSGAATGSSNPLAVVMNSAKSVTAAYSAIRYAITYNLDGGTNNSGNPSIYTVESATITLAAPTRIGHAFGGWYDNVGLSGNAIVSIPLGSTGNKEFWAKWTASVMTVTFNANGGSSPIPASKTVVYGSTYGTLASASNDGYTFSGWWTAPSGGTEVTSTSTVTQTSDHVLYAGWTAVTMAVTFNSSGGTTPNPASKQVTYGSSYGALATTSRAGYTFEGWWTGTGGTGTSITSTSIVTQTAAHTLYAKWSPNSYAITFDKNDSYATGSMAAQYIQTGTSANLSPNAYSKGGRIFVGWATTPAGSVVFSNSAVYDMGTENDTLYAKWEIRDIDGNVYTALTFGNQEWMVENFRAVRYIDGTFIPHIQASSGQWSSSMASHAYCYLRDTTDVQARRKFGAIYNWYVVDPTNPMQIAPEGWRVASSDDWYELELYLIANGYNPGGTPSGDSVAQSMAAKTDWSATSVPGTPGYDLAQNNRSGFTAYPAGKTLNSVDGTNVISFGSKAQWWTSSKDGSNPPNYRSIVSGTPNLYGLADDGPYVGRPVRLVRNIN